MIEAVPMTAREANDKGHRIGNHSFEEDGYEVTYPDGYKSWSPAKEFEKAYYKLEDPAGDVLKETKEVNSINANGLYVIRKAGSNRAGFI